MKAVICAVGMLVGYMCAGTAPASADETVRYVGEIVSKAAKGYRGGRDVEVAITGLNVTFQVAKRSISNATDSDDETPEPGATKATLEGKSFNVVTPKSKTRYKGELRDDGLDFVMEARNCVYSGKLKAGT